MQSPGCNSMARWADLMESLHENLVFVFCGLVRTQRPAPHTLYLFEVTGSLTHCCCRWFLAVLLANQFLDILIWHFAVAFGWVAHCIADRLVGQVHLCNSWLLLNVLVLGLMGAHA